jgi:rhamnose transport system permease protein
MTTSSASPEAASLPQPGPRPPAKTGTGRAADSLRNLLRYREVGILSVLLLLILVTALGNDRFLGPVNLQGMELDWSGLAILAAGEAVVIITRNVDLSVGSTMGLSAYVAGDIMAKHQHLPAVFAVLAAVGVGAACGLLNGLLVAVAGAPALVATLGTLYGIRGLDYYTVGSNQVVSSQIPAGYDDLAGGKFIGVPYPVYLALGVVVVTSLYLRNLRSGRDLYAIGSNPPAAQRIGIAVRRRLFGAFVASGALAGLAGAIYTARYAAVDSGVGTGMELNVVAAAVVGGVAIFGGSGSVVGAAIGAALLTAIGSSLGVLGVNPYWVQAMVGVLILGAIAVDKLVLLRLANRMRERRRI